MTTISKTAAVLTALALALGACGGSDDATSSSTSDQVVDSVESQDSMEPQDSGVTSTTELSESADLEPSGVLRFATLLHPDGWDPHLESRGYGMTYFGAVYDGLVNEQPDGTLVPGLATEWEQTTTELRFRLREGVTFHDGTPFDAEAVAYNVDLLQSQPGANSAFLSSISEVEVVSPSEVVFHLSQRDGDLLPSLARMPGMMVSPGVAPADVQAGTPAGTGPYQIAEFVDGRTVLEINPNFWDPTQQGVEAIEFIELADDSARFNALVTGEVDIAALRAPQVEPARQEGFGVVEAPSRISHLQIIDILGTQAPELADQRVREAIFRAIDKEAWRTVVGGGFGAPVDQYFDPATPWHLDDLETYEYDPELARQLLAEAGAEGLVLQTTTWGSFTLGNQVLQQMLAEVGITLELGQVAPGGDTASLQAGEREVNFTYMSSNHPETMFDAYFNPDLGRNPFGGYGPGVEDALEVLAAAETPDEELEAQRQLLTAIHDGAWALPILADPGFTAYRDSVENLVGWNFVVMGVDLRHVRLTD